MNLLFLTLTILVFLSDDAKSQSQFIKDLMSKMTIEDKCGHMTQVTFDVISKNFTEITDPTQNPVDMNKLLVAVKDKRVGSILNTPFNTAQLASTWQLIIKTIQDQALQSNLKIPILYGLDSIHGANYIRESTLFPQPISMAASFNLDIVKNVARYLGCLTVILLFG